MFLSTTVRVLYSLVYRAEYYEISPEKWIRMTVTETKEIMPTRSVTFCSKLSQEAARHGYTMCRVAVSSSWDVLFHAHLREKLPAGT